VSIHIDAINLKLDILTLDDTEFIFGIISRYAIDYTELFPLILIRYSRAINEIKFSIARRPFIFDDREMDE